MDNPLSDENIISVLKKRHGEKEIAERFEGLPLLGQSCKFGTSGLDKFLTRLGNYQQAVGPDLVLCWNNNFIGTEEVSNRLEDAFKLKFKSRRFTDRLGEWYDGFTAKTMAPEILKLIDGYGYKIKPTPKQFNPILYENMKDMQKKMKEYYKKPAILSEFLVG